MTNTGYAGAKNETSGLGDFNERHLAMQQALSGINTATLVRVTAATNSGELSPVGFVDVQPLVDQLDGALQVMPHAEVFHLPYMRLQGGANAVIIDPQVGDIGIALFADRDISVVKDTRGQAAPGSGRRFDMADGLYIGGFLNATPVQYIQFTADGINVVSPTKLTLTAPEVEINASTSFTVNAPQSTFSAMVTINGLLTFVAGIAGSAADGVVSTITGVMAFFGTLTSNGKHVDDTHTHGGVQPGSGSSGPPT